MGMEKTYSYTSTPMTIVLGGRNVDGTYSPTTSEWGTEDGKPHINPELEELFSSGKRYKTKHKIYPSIRANDEYDVNGVRMPLRRDGDEVTLDFIKKLIDNDDLESSTITLEELTEDDLTEDEPMSWLTAERKLYKNRHYDEPLADDLREKYQKIIDDFWQRPAADSYFGDDDDDDDVPLSETKEFNDLLDERFPILGDDVGTYWDDDDDDDDTYWDQDNINDSLSDLR